MKTNYLAVFLLLLGHSMSNAAEQHSLFDGKSFQGWEGDTNKSFRIEAGAIVGGSLSNAVPRNEFLATKRAYTNFVLELDWKVLGKGVNGGVQIRSARIPNHHEVSGYQADLGDPSWWGCLYDESRRNKVLAQAPAEIAEKTIKREAWNHYTIRCEGKRIQLSINGHATVDYTETESGIADGGIIALQIHGGGPSEAWYKNIVVSELP